MAAYRRLCTEFYDLDKPSAPAEALAFYTGRARRADGRILEPMCGSGRFLLPMSLAGLQVDGVDSSPEMLEACRTHARALGVDVSVFQQDLASLELPHRYSLAFIPSGSIGLITETEALRRALSRIYTHMVPSGTLLLEIASDSRQAITPTDFEPRTVRCADGSSITYTCSASNSKRSDTICYSGTYTRRLGDRVIETEVEELVLRLYDAEQLSAELASCGFKTTAVGDQSALAFLAESGCTLVEARADA
jgi:SAM-dependent methyltransferase